MTVWSPQQDEALSKAGAWLRLKYAPTFYLGGYAGTGKSTIANHVAQHAKGKVAFAAFTGKAARVMRKKGCEGARTIHSLIYNVDELNDGTIVTKLRPKDELSMFSLFVIDECSMVNEEMGKDLLSFGIPVLVLGDPAQLPPVSGAGYFTTGQPDYMLTEVHRQAAESPILRVATEIREGRFSPGARHQETGLTITRKSGLNRDFVTESDIVIVGRNNTRQAYNKRLRELAGRISQVPVAGEPMICLRNERLARVFNGDIFQVEKAKSRKACVRLWMRDPDDGRAITPVDVRKEFFFDDVAASRMGYADLKGTHQFTFGYAITCHKSQGSQWSSVCVFDESRVFGENQSRWLYTAVTRASDHLTLVV